MTEKASRGSLGERFVNSTFSERNPLGRLLRYVLVRDHEQIPMAERSPEQAQPTMRESVVREHLLWGRKVTVYSGGQLPREGK